MPTRERPDSSGYRAELRQLISESVNETLSEYQVMDLSRPQFCGMGSPSPATGRMSDNVVPLYASQGR